MSKEQELVARAEKFAKEFTCKPPENPETATEACMYDQAVRHLRDKLFMQFLEIDTQARDESRERIETLAKIAEDALRSLECEGGISEDELNAELAQIQNQRTTQ